MIIITIKALAQTNSFNIRKKGEVHSGKVRSVYWLTNEDSRRLVKKNSYSVHKDTSLGVMITSDRISAFNVNWHAEGDLQGVPGKGAALNAISGRVFDLLENLGADHHLLDKPHPLVWIVQRASPPVMVESIARQYITGSMWRAYEAGERVFCGEELPKGLEKNQRLDSLLITPTTKGILTGLNGVKEEDDTPITVKQIRKYWRELGFMQENDVDKMLNLTKKAFEAIENFYSNLGQIFVDTKFEMGYFRNPSGPYSLGFMDEVATPDSSRMWNKKKYQQGIVSEESKEGFRAGLIDLFGKEMLTDESRVAEKKSLAMNTALPSEQFAEVSKTYSQIALAVTGAELQIPEKPVQEIEDVLNDYGLML